MKAEDLNSPFSEQENLIQKRTLSATESKIDQMNTNALNRLNFLDNQRKITLPSISSPVKISFEEGKFWPTFKTSEKSMFSLKSTSFSLRGLFDAPRTALQTRIGEKPPVLETNRLVLGSRELKVFDLEPLGFKSFAPLVAFDFKPVSEKYSWTKFVNPINALRLVGKGAYNIATLPINAIMNAPKLLTANGIRNGLKLIPNAVLRTVSFITPKDYKNIGSVFTSIPLTQAIGYRGRQALGAGLTMAAHAGNTLTKTAALIHYYRKMSLIKQAISEKSTIYTSEHLESTRQERNETSKNLAIATVATTGLVGGTLLTAGVAPVVWLAHTVAAGSHGLITTNTIEAAGATKKLSLWLKRNLSI